jgi:hypothetical protein
MSRLLHVNEELYVGKYDLPETAQVDITGDHSHADLYFLINTIITQHLDTVFSKDVVNAIGILAELGADNYMLNPYVNVDDPDNNLFQYVDFHQLPQTSKDIIVDYVRGEEPRINNDRIFEHVISSDPPELTITLDMESGAGRLQGFQTEGQAYVDEATDCITRARVAYAEVLEELSEEFEGEQQYFNIDYRHEGGYDIVDDEEEDSENGYHVNEDGYEEAEF